MLDSAATILNTGTKILNGEASGGAAIANALLGESFMASAAAAWSAAAGFLAATWPLLVIVGVIALVVYAVYELGKSFGWWTDVSSMIDAIKAGIMRLWEAFINHPDVQAVIQALSDVWNALSGAIASVSQAVMDFFGINTGGEFDIVRALIDGIGLAWQTITAPIRWVISLVGAVINIFNQLLNGQISFQQAVVMIWTTLSTAWGSILSGIRSLIVRMFSRFVTTAIARTNALVLGAVRALQRLPGRAYNALIGVVTKITQAGQKWVNTARNKAGDVVTAVHNKISGISSKISSALSGVVNAFTKPFKDAYNGVKEWVGKIKSKASEVPSLNLGAGGDYPDEITGSLAAGGDYSTSLDVLNGKLFEINTGEYVVEEQDLNINVNEVIMLDLANVPNNLDKDELMNWLQTAIGDKGLIRTLVENSDFQDMDMKVKQTLFKKNARRG